MHRQRLHRVVRILVTVTAVIVFGAGGGAAAVAWLRANPPAFEAWMVVAPSTDYLIDGATGLSTEDRGLVDALVGAGENTVTPYQRFLRLLTSEEVAEQVHADRPDLVRRILGSTADNHSVAPPTETGWPARATQAVFDAAGVSTPAVTPPRALAERLTRDLVIDRVDASAMRRVSIVHSDRDVAVALLRGVQAAADRVLRETATARVDTQIAYLTGQLDHIRLVEHRRALGVLLGQQERLAMILAADGPFAAEMVERPTSLDRATVPSPLLVVATGTGVGLALGLVGAARLWGWA